MLWGNVSHHNKKLASNAALHNNDRSPLVSLPPKKELMMKKSIALLCFALCTGAGSAAQAGNTNDAFCTQLSNDIAARSALFVKVASAGPELTDKDLALHNISNEIWSLRTRMAYLDCTLAKTFAY
jgi:hypothetical protein